MTSDNCINPYYNPKTGIYHACGQCPACLRARKREWMLRLSHEAEYYQSSSVFVTLTYNDANLPSSGSLIKRDYQLFLKRLRKYYSYYKIRYYVVGEYGKLHDRPHFHFILFGVPQHVFLPYKPSSSFGWFVSRVLNHLWDKGYNTIGSVTTKSISYVAGYVQKKQYGNKLSYYTQKNLVPPFCHSSQGIGKRYCLDHIEQIRRELHLLDANGYTHGVPRYYRTLLGIDSTAYTGYIDFHLNEKICDYESETGCIAIESIAYGFQEWNNPSYNYNVNAAYSKYATLDIDKRTLFVRSIHGYVTFSENYIKWIRKRAKDYAILLRAKHEQRLAKLVI